MCVVYIQQPNHSWIEHKRTEQIINSLDPEFSTKIPISYHFEELQKLKFKIFDIDSRSSVLDNHDFLGEAECSLGQIVSSGNHTLDLHHPKSKSKAQLFIRAEEIGGLKEELELRFTAKDFKKSGLLSKPDPFLAIYKDQVLIHRTKFIKDDCSPKWPAFAVPMRTLRTKDGQDLKLSLQCWNWNGDGKHKLMGEVQATTQELLHAPQSFSLADKVCWCF